MKKKLLGALPYIAALAVNFYLLPRLISDTGTAMVLMLCAMPLLTFIISLLYGVRQGFSFLLPAAAMALFAPTVLLYYNETAWLYMPVYGVLSLAGNGVGRIFYRKR